MGPTGIIKIIEIRFIVNNWSKGNFIKSLDNIKTAYRSSIITITREPKYYLIYLAVIWMTAVKNQVNYFLSEGLLHIILDKKIKFYSIIAKKFKYTKVK